VPKRFWNAGDFPWSSPILVFSDHGKATTAVADGGLRRGRRPGGRNAFSVGFGWFATALADCRRWAGDADGRGSQLWPESPMLGLQPPLLFIFLFL